MKPMRSGAFLTRLLQDTSANTLAIMAAAFVPLVGLIGGGVDVSRMYLVKTRLQQACDAGALSGRKEMGGGSWTTGANSSQARANGMFDANFANGDYGTGTLTRNFTESNGVVTGTASVPVPMTLMKVFGFTQQVMNVTCTAKMEIPNTDVMFVLDVTYSMAGSRIAGLHSAVKCFYEALQRVNTSEVCGNDPSATSSTTTAQIRLGFVPYGVNVNVGRLLPNSYIADNWPYQSRRWFWDGTTYDTSTNNGSWSLVSGSKSSQNYSNQSSCPSDTMNQTTSGPTTSTTTAPNGTITITETVTRTTTGYDITNCNSSGGRHPTYSYKKTTYNNYVEQKVTTTTKSPHYAYSYEQRTLNVSGLKAGGSNWNSSVSLDVGNNGAMTSVGWDGCIEERKTYQNTDGNPSDDWDPIPGAAIDMDIDRVPDPSNQDTLWGPMLPDAVWARYSGNTNSLSYSPITTTSNLSHNTNHNIYNCAAPARKLKEYRTVGDLETYIDSLAANDLGTYHDIGMLWGARLLSPTGIFASENALTANGGAIQRHLIFMTDGNAQTVYDNFSSYGLAFYDRRQFSTGNPSTTQMDNLVNARLLALCTAVKNKNITLWVISYGGGVDEANENRLKTCATQPSEGPNSHFFSAEDGDALRARFQQIASEIADLRLTS